MQIKNFKKKFMAFALSAFTVVSLASGFMQPVSANDGLTYNGIGQHASEGKFLLDVKNSTVEVNGTEISSEDGSRQEVDNGTVLKIKNASYIVVFNKDGSQESYKGDLDYQTTSNTAYVSVLGGVQQGRRRNRRSTGDVNALVVGDTFSGTFGTNNTNPTLGVDTFYVDAVTGLLAQVSNQIIGSQYVTCQEHGYIGLTNINAWSNGQKAEYTYNATVTSVTPDGTVTLAIDVPHYLKPGTSEEATGYNLDMGGTVPYQRCAGTWVIKTAPRTMQMYVKVHKHNGNPDITENNECYAQNLSGAVYGVFADQACTNKLGEITTDANGDGVLQNITVNSGIYVYVKELKAPKGFNLDTKIYPVYSLSHEAKGWDVDSTDYPMNDPVAIKLTKKSEDNVENPASLEGAEFTVKYYAGQYTKETLPGTATRTWVIKTLKNNSGKYITRLGDKYKVSGDDFYVEPNTGVPTLPLGTLTVEETKAPEGYTLKNKTLNANNEDITDGVALFNITENLQGIPQMVGGNEYTIEEGVQRTKIDLTKVDEETGEPIGPATFDLINMNDFDVVAKDENGNEIGRALAHEKFNYQVTIDKSGKFISSQNFLPKGMYKLVEVNAPDGYLKTVIDVEMKDDVNELKINEKLKKPTLKTTAYESLTNSKLIPEGKVSLTDKIEYDSIHPGKYEVTTTMVDADTEEVYGTTKKIVELTTWSGEFLIKQDEVDTSKLGGKNIVFYEDIVGLESHRWDCSHRDLSDKGQTVSVTKIRTEAYDTKDKDHWLDGTQEKQNFIDKVSYSGLVPGKKYTTTGTLIDPITEKPLLVDGKEVTKTVEFTPTEPDGYMEVPFEVSGIKLAGKKFVLFEDVHDEAGALVGMHHDIHDEDQTLKTSLIISVKVIKADAIDKDKKLAGAEFTVFNKDGSVATDKSGNKLVGTTNANGEVEFKIDYDVDKYEDMYIMETKAPEGYNLSTEKFAIKRTDNPENGVENIAISVLDDKIPPTGVKSNTLVFAGIAIVAVLALGVLIVTKKKENK